MTMQVDSRALVRQLRLEGVGLSLRMSAEEAFGGLFGIGDAVMTR
jgi:hypothetical protein